MKCNFDSARPFRDHAKRSLIFSGITPESAWRFVPDNAYATSRAGIASQANTRAVKDPINSPFGILNDRGI